MQKRIIHLKETVTLRYIPLLASSAFMIRGAISSFIYGNRPEQPFPSSIHLELTNRCNAKCDMCAHPTHLRTRGRMTDEMFNKIVNEIKDNIQYDPLIVIAGLGEPLLHPNIKTYLYQLAAIGVRIKLITNLQALTEELAECIAETCDMVQVSMVGFTAENYARFMGVSQKIFPKILNNVEILAKACDKAPYPPHVKLRSTYWKETHEDILALIDYAEQYGFEAAWYARGNWAGAVETKHGKWQLFFAKIIPCNMLKAGPTISWDGRLGLCCADSEIAGLKKPVSLETHTIAKMWDCQEMNEVRDLHCKGKRGQVELCSKCVNYY